MTKQEKAQVLQGLVKLAAAFNHSMSPQQQEVYLEDLSDLPLMAIGRAMVSARKSCKFFPSIAELREFSGQGQSKQSLEDAAMLAWDHLTSIPGRTHNPAALDCPITKKCFKALGGNNRTLTGFRMWPTDQEQWKRKEFIGLYCAYARSQVALQECGELESQGILKQLWWKGD